jgi:hypothetical protein
MTNPYRTPEKPALVPSKFIQIAPTDKRLFALDEDGRVWVCWANVVEINGTLRYTQWVVLPKVEENQ